MKEFILNIHNFHSSKQNKDYTILLIQRELYDSERKNGYIGEFTTEEVFLPDELTGMFGSKDIGHEIERVYSVIGGKAYLENIIMKGEK